MNVLVTGGGGFLGRHVCAALQACGHAVKSFSRQPHAHLTEALIPQITGSITSYDDVLAALAGSDGVVHCAAKAGVWGQQDDFYQTNVVGTANVLRAMRAKGVRWPRVRTLAWVGPLSTGVATLTPPSPVTGTPVQQAINMSF